MEKIEDSQHSYYVHKMHPELNDFKIFFFLSCLTSRFESKGSGEMKYEKKKIIEYHDSF